MQIPAWLNALAILLAAACGYGALRYQVKANEKRFAEEIARVERQCKESVMQVDKEVEETRQLQQRDLESLKGWQDERHRETTRRLDRLEESMNLVSGEVKVSREMQMQMDKKLDRLLEK